METESKKPTDESGINVDAVRTICFQNMKTCLIYWKH